MKTSHKQTVLAFLWGLLFTFILLCAKYLYLNWPGPGEKGYEEIRPVFEIFHGAWLQLACLLGVLAFTFLTVKTNRQTKKRLAVF